MSKMSDIGIAEMTHGLETGALTSEALIRELLSQVERDQGLNIWLEVKSSEILLAEAKTSDERRAEGKALGPLDGVPIGIKDNINVRGLKTQCASKLLRGYRPPFNATVVEKLLAQGAILVGKLNMDEFAMGSSNEYSAFGGAKNPLGSNTGPEGARLVGLPLRLLRGMYLEHWEPEIPVFDSATSIVLWCRRPKAHLQRGLALWCCSVRQLT